MTERGVWLRPERELIIARGAELSSECLRCAAGPAMTDENVWALAYSAFRCARRWMPVPHAGRSSRWLWVALGVDVAVLLQPQGPLANSC